ncbi:MAG: hypothetical protein JSS75_04785 [Bacteroidetes bacterium]|nr:hypothetical protein [Bacteroidota bacterium]
MNHRILLVFVALAALTLSSCSRNDPMEVTSSQFLTTIHDGKLDDAYTITSPTLQKVTNKDQFKAFIQTLGLADYRSLRWYGHMQMDSSGYVEGAITRKDSVVVPVKLHLSQVNGEWKVNGMERLPGFGLAGNISQQFPPDAVVRGLVAQWLTLLDRSIKAKDFSEFYSKMSPTGQRLSSTDNLMKGFSKFIENSINISAALSSKAIVTPYISSDLPNQPRILLVECTFQTSPQLLHVTMKFSSESGAWQLLSMNASI